MVNSNVEAIKEAITALSDQDKIAIASWLNLQTMDDWDRQMADDFSPGGQGAAFVELMQREVAEGLEAGTLQPLEEGLAERRNRRH